MIELCHKLCESFLPAVAVIAGVVAIIFGAITMLIKYSDASFISEDDYEIPWFITRIALYIALASVAILLFFALITGMYEHSIHG